MLSQKKVVLLLCCLFWLAACTPAGSESSDGDPTDVVISEDSADDANNMGNTTGGDGADQDLAAPIDQLAAALIAQGLSVEMGDHLKQPFFNVAGQNLLVAGESVQLFLFPDEAAAQAAAEQVSPDGSAIATTMVSWIAPPHFYHHGALIVIYPGTSETIISALVQNLGEQFAGAMATGSTSGLSEPPPAFLTIDGVRQESGIGSYCWIAGEDPGTCADMIGIPTQQTPLQANPLVFLQFDLHVDQRPVNSVLSVRSFTQEDALDMDAGSWQWWPYNEPDSSFHLPGVVNPQIELTLPAGLNVITLSVSWPDYGDVSYGFLVNVATEGSGSGSQFWSLSGDPRTGVRFAVPCFWRTELPEVDPTGLGSFPVENYSAELVESLGSGEGVFAIGGLKIDFNYLRPTQLGLSAGAPLENIPAPLMGPDVTIEEIVSVQANGQSGVRVLSRDMVFNEREYSYLFSIEADLVLLLGLVPGEAVDHPDIQAIINSLALTDEVAVKIPEIIPAGPPAGDGPHVCMKMGAQVQPDVMGGDFTCESIATGGPEPLACAIRDALRARDMVTVEELMADPMVIGYWQSEGVSGSPAYVANQLSETLLPADTSDLSFTTDRARFPDLQGMPVEDIFGPNDLALIIFSEGWGQDGQGAALLYLVYDEESGLHWRYILYAGGSFD